MSQPRQHHYIFVHQVLPSIFYADPAKFFDILTKEKDNLLHLLWNQIAEGLNETDRLTTEGLKVEIRKVEDDINIGLIILPPPKGITEAYFAAIVYKPSTRQDLSLARFITLEYGVNLDGSSRTVLCEWTANRSHTNHGNGPSPTIEAFLKGVSTLFKE